MNVPQNLGALYQICCAALKNDLEARFMLESRGGFSWADIIAHPDKPVPAPVLEILKRDLERRLSGMTLSRIYGERQFYGLDFLITPSTLDPRADTETLVDAVLEAYGDQPPANFIDLGTGSGCIAITLLHAWKTTRALAVDVSREALITARRNALRHNVDERLDFICGNWAEAINSSFDLVVSNPPYIAESVILKLAPEVRNHDPILALSGGEDGLMAYKKIFSGLNDLLKPGGKGFFEIGFDQAESVMRLSGESKLSPGRIHRDLAGNPRVAEISMGISKK
ncbi:MAG: peptide chain release factor N(5)-glutamine methyltransferase [Alphaproteobacteria bacterium]